MIAVAPMSAARFASSTATMPFKQKGPSHLLRIASARLQSRLWSSIEVKYSATDLGTLDPSETCVARLGRLNFSRSIRSEEHTSELQSLMRISYAVFCLKKKNT